MKLPLAGIRVIELGTHVAVPMIARSMADWGAEVIKVESIKGDEWRMFGKGYSVPANDDENPVFSGQNANKQFVAINLKTDEGLDILFKLLATADVFVSNVRMKSLKKMGLDYDTLKERFPQLVYAHLNGYGQKGPDAERPGFDKSAFWARSGILIDCAYADGYPMDPIAGFGDSIVGSIMLAGVLAGLIGRDRTGKGTFVASSLYGCAIWHVNLGIISSQEAFGDKYPKDYMYPPFPFSHIYQCKGGDWLIITIIDHDKWYEPMCRILGMEEYINDERFKTLKEVKKNEHAFVSMLKERFLTKTRQEWCRILDENDMAHECLNSFADISKDPQAWENNYLKKVTFPSGTEAVMPCNPISFSSYDSADVKPTRGIGCDTTHILEGLGYSPEKIGQLREAGTIK